MLKNIKRTSILLYRNAIVRSLFIPILFSIGASLLLLFVVESRMMILSAIIGFGLGKTLFSLASVIIHATEDKRKAIRDYKKLAIGYDANIYGNKALVWKGKKSTLQPLFYEELFTNLKGNSIQIIDIPTSMHRVPSELHPYYATLLNAHKASYLENSITYRLANAVVSSNNESLTLFTERTTYFNHLVTNRAMDYPISDLFTVRKMYEFEKKLSSLRESKLANQIGINAIILFSDGYTLLPRRGFTGTVSKNRITSSLAVRLNTEDTSKILTTEAIEENLVKQMKNRLFFDEAICKGNKKIEFLGIGRDLCEGGKPQMYYLITLDSSSVEYGKSLTKQIKKSKKSGKQKLDYDKTIYLAKFSSLMYLKNHKLSFEHRICKGKKFRNKKVRVSAEVSFFFNLWHYAKVKQPDTFRIKTLTKNEIKQYLKESQDD